MMTIFAFVTGLFLGSVFGILVAAVLSAASSEEIDDEM